jgi:hypothetical protein
MGFGSLNPHQSHQFKAMEHKPGFTDALRVATRGSRLSGPLKAPYEPGHYSFIT